MIKNNKDYSVVDKLFNRNAKKMRINFARKHREMLATSQLFKETVNHCRLNGWKTHESLWNTCLFVHLVGYDLSILVEDLAFEREIWRRRFVARNVALLAYEATEDMQSLLGKAFRESLETLQVLSRFELQLKDARKPLDVFWKENQFNLKKIRVSAAAHRDHDGLAMLNIIEDISIDETLTLGFSLGGIINDIGKVLQRIVNETSTITPPEIHKGH